MDSSEDINNLIPPQLIIVARIIYLSSFISLFIAVISLTESNFVTLGIFAILSVILYLISKGLQQIDENARKSAVGIFSILFLYLLIFQPLEIFLSVLVAIPCGVIAGILIFDKQTRFIFTEILTMTKLEKRV